MEDWLKCQIIPLVKYRQKEICREIKPKPEGHEYKTIFIVFCNWSVQLGNLKLVNNFIYVLRTHQIIWIIKTINNLAAFNTYNFHKFDFILVQENMMQCGAPLSPSGNIKRATWESTFNTSILEAPVLMHLWTSNFFF